ncbi:MAG: glucose-6-phosphate dehydrogenase assembly protein OpcA [Candidatus Thiodiazotropha sp.]
MNETSRDRLRRTSQINVRIRNIQQELDALWAGLQQDLNTEQVVTRACMSNLIIYCDDDRQTHEIDEALPYIVLPHPCRVVLLTGVGDTGEPGLDVFVSGLYRQLSGGIQVSAELIRVIADAGAHKRLAPVARAHLVGDLPTTLWWASQEPAPFLGEVFSPLTAMADQIIYDSFGWRAPTKGMQAMSRWVKAQSSEYVIYNLAWRRLKHWRNLISQALSPALQPNALSGVTRLQIMHGPHTVAMTSLLVGWLASRLGWRVEGGKVTAGKQTVWQFGVGNRQVPVTLTRLPDAPPGPLRVDWRWREGAGEYRAVFADLGADRLGVIEADSDIPVCLVPAPSACEAQLVAAQMAHRSRDRVFERALETGNAMTGVLLG